MTDILLNIMSFVGRCVEQFRNKKFKKKIIRDENFLFQNSRYRSGYCHQQSDRECTLLYKEAKQYFHSPQKTSLILKVGSFIRTNLCKL